MYIPFQTVFASSLLYMGMLKNGSKVSSGTIVDYCEKKCVNDAGDQACTVPFLVSAHPYRTVAMHAVAALCCVARTAA